MVDAWRIEVSDASEDMALLSFCLSVGLSRFVAPNRCVDLNYAGAVGLGCLLQLHGCGDGGGYCGDVGLP